MNSQNSRILSYSKSLKTIGSPDGTVNLGTNNHPIKLTGTNNKIRLIDFTIDSQIPNVYNYGGTNNGLLRVSVDDGATWTIIQLDNGVYSVTEISNAINAAISSSYTLSTDPGIIIRANTVVKKVYMIIDSSKLAVASQIRIDFGYSTSRITELLGFVSTTMFIADGTYTASDFPQIDWIGNSISVELELGTIKFGVTNSDATNEICRVNLATATVTNTYTYPNIQQPAITIPPETIYNYGVKVYGTKLNTDLSKRPVYLLNGEVYLRFEIIS